MQRKTSAVIVGISLVAASVLAVEGPAGTAAASASTPVPVVAANAARPLGNNGVPEPRTPVVDTSPSRLATLTPKDAHPVEPSVTSLPIKAAISAASAGAKGANATKTATVTAPVGTRSFQTVGVTWRRGSGGAAAAGLTVQVRSHGAKGWSSWQDLDLDESTLTDAAQATPDQTATPASVPTAVRDGTSALYVGPSDGAEAKVTAAGVTLPQDLQLDLVDPGSSDHDADATPENPVTGQAVAATGVAQPQIFSRAEWGADEKMVRDNPTYMSTVKAAVLHHTAGPNGYSKAEVPAIIRGDYAFHVKSRGWDDIGYNALVDRFGRIWEGRGGGLDRDVMGAHAGGFNTDTFGVAVIGSYQYAHPTAAMTTSIGQLFAWKLALNHRDPKGTAKLTSSGGGTARYRAGTTVTLPAIMGHRNTGFTECPGGNLYAKLPVIRDKALADTPAGLIDPVGAPDSVILGDPVSIKATALRDQTWKLTVTGPCGAGKVATVSGKASAGKKITATWDGKLTGGALAPAGRYHLSLTSSSSQGAARPVTDDVLVVPPAMPAETAATPLGGAGGYVSVTPTRIYDSRATGLRALGPAGRAQINVLGRAGVPTSSVTAVVLNLTAQCVSDTTSLSVWPTGGTRSTLPLTTATGGSTRSVLVTTAVGSNGQVSVGNLAGVTQLTADVVGYYTTSGGPLRAIPSTRVYDSATSSNGADKSPMRDETRIVTLPATVGGIASSQVKALLVDVGGVAPGKSGTLTARAPGATESLPGTTFSGATIADNLTVVPVINSQFQLTATGGPIRAILDATGVVLASPGPGSSVSGSFLTAVTPRRVLGGVAVAPGSPRKVVVTGGAVPSTATAVLVQLGGAAPSVGATAQAYAWGTTAPGGTSLRVPKNLTRGNLMLVPVGTDGAVALSTSGSNVRLSLDVYGYLS